MLLEKYFRENRGELYRVAQALSVTPQSVYDWKKRQVPADRVIALCKAIDMRILPHELRPDVYPLDIIAYRKDKNV